MKKIILNTAALSNAGERIAAGETVKVGDEPDQIDAARAKALVADGSAAPADVAAKSAATDEAPAK